MLSILTTQKAIIIIIIFERSDRNSRLGTHREARLDKQKILGSLSGRLSRHRSYRYIAI